ncbi:TPA: hypothetical protein ACKJ3X_000847 [Neisseria gonorrhoeae]|uniref:hypothetical protein n=1 Tax=Neisseria gonorrhoeae TaxID=485 RepID=UPI0035C4BB23
MNAAAVSAVFKERIASHAEHVKKVAHICTTEETTKQALILPLLDILGFSAFDPNKVRAEYQADFPGAKSGERVDYAAHRLCLSKQNHILKICPIIVRSCRVTSMPRLK